jgi:hypothetical protein
LFWLSAELKSFQVVIIGLLYVQDGSVYLNCEFAVLDGPYAKRKMWSLIGLHSPKGPEWANMGRAFVKGILNSARGLHPQDNTHAMSECLVFSLRKKTLRENTWPYRYHGLKIFTSLKLRFQDFQRSCCFAWHNHRSNLERLKRSEDF